MPTIPAPNHLINRALISEVPSVGHIIFTVSALIFTWNILIQRNSKLFPFLARGEYLLLISYLSPS